MREADMSTNVVSSGRNPMRVVEEGVGRIGRLGWRFFHKLPGHGALLGGAAGLAGVMYIGVGEMIAACFGAYLSYRMFAYGESFPEALQNTIRFEKGELPKDEMGKPIVK